MNGTFGLDAAIEDAYGNVVTSSSSTVKVALSSNPAGAKLGGTTSEKATAGLAVFSGLTISKAGSGYTLALSSTGLTGAVTSPITVSSSVGSAAAVAGPTQVLLAPLVLGSPDLSDTPGIKKHTRST